VTNVWLVLAVGVVAIAGYFIYTATQSNECTGSIWDYVNPACLFSGVTTEVNTVLIVVGVVIVAVIALLAFGSQTSHLTNLAGAALV
jgi:hypothetical protein